MTSFSIITPLLFLDFIIVISALRRYQWWSIVTGADIPLNCRLGGGFLLPHPNGIVIHPEAEIWKNCLLFQHITIGIHGSGVPKKSKNMSILGGAPRSWARSRWAGTTRLAPMPSCCARCPRAQRPQ